MTAVVDLPTPPLPDATAIRCLMPGNAAAARGGLGWRRRFPLLRRAFGRQGHHGFFDTGNGEHRLLDGTTQNLHRPHMLGRGGEREHHRSALDRDIGDEPGGDDVAPTVGRRNALQNREDVILREGGHMVSILCASDI